MWPAVDGLGLGFLPASMFGISIRRVVQPHLTAEPFLILKLLYLCVFCHAKKMHSEWLFSDTCCHIVTEWRFPFAAVFEMWVRRLMCHYDRWMTVINSWFLQWRMRHDATVKCQPDYAAVSLNKTCICSINYLSVSNQNLCLRKSSGSVLYAYFHSHALDFLKPVFICTITDDRCYTLWMTWYK